MASAASLAPVASVGYFGSVCSLRQLQIQPKADEYHATGAGPATLSESSLYTVQGGLINVGGSNQRF